MKEDNTSYSNGRQAHSWNDCHIDIWFTISEFLRPEDIGRFAGICKKTRTVADSEMFWKSLFNRFIKSKYKWVDIPGNTPGSCVRDATIRELFKNYQPFVKRTLTNDPDSYDKASNKVCLQITHAIDEIKMIRTYSFKLQSRATSQTGLAARNRDEFCELLQVKTIKFVPVPYDSERLVIKSITKTLSQGYRSFKLKIKFCDQFGNTAGEELVFDPIISVFLFDWWEEKYTTNMF